MLQGSDSLRTPRVPRLRETGRGARPPTACDTQGPWSPPPPASRWAAPRRNSQQGVRAWHQLSSADSGWPKAGGW